LNKMLFEEIITDRLLIIREAIEELIGTSLKMQTHPQDLLLVINHAFFNYKIPDNFCYQNKVSKFAFGPSDIGRSEDTHLEFISWYFDNHQVNKEIYLTVRKNNLELTKLEERSINIEKAIYLKFWEAEMIIKYFYQLSLLCQGIHYNWYFKTPSNSREGSKQDVLRSEVKNKLKSICPKFYNLLDITYSPQIRNAIAHSQYYFGSRNIKYLNFSDNPKAHNDIETLTFDQWAMYFHNTVLLYMILKQKFVSVEKTYIDKASEKGFLETRIIRTDEKEIFQKIRLKDKNRGWTIFH